jgi:hypothetical protein
MTGVASQIEAAAGAAATAATKAAGGASLTAAAGIAGSAAGAAGGGGDTYNFNIPEFSDPTTTAQKLQTMLRDLKRRNGGAALGLG